MGLYVVKDALVELAIQLKMPAAPISISGSYFIENKSNSDHKDQATEYADNGFPTNRVNPGINNRVHHTLFLMNAYKLNITYPTKKVPTEAINGKNIRSEKVIYRYEFPHPRQSILDIYAWFERGRVLEVPFEVIEAISIRTRKMLSKLRPRYRWAESLYQSLSQFEERLWTTPSSKKQFAEWYSLNRSGK